MDNLSANTIRSERMLRSFMLLLIGQTVSQMGSSMTSFAVVIWAYTQTGAVMASSLLAICNAVPYLLVSLLGGTIADNIGKKKLMLICDTAAAVGSVLILGSMVSGHLRLWILCGVNVLNGFMNAFQKPASEIAVSLMVDRKDYVRIGGLQSIFNSAARMLNPVLAAVLLGVGGLGLVLAVDLMTFLFAFATLLLFVKIPEELNGEKKTTFREIKSSMKEGVAFIGKQKSLLYLLMSYGVLEFIGAISFDSMYSPLLLARTGNNEMVVGIVSSMMAAGCFAASILLVMFKEVKKKVPLMILGSLMCLTGIMFFGMGRNLYWWCVVVFMGCFGSPIYHTFQTAILREHVPLPMQGRIFAMQGMITQLLVPLGYLTGAVLADRIFEPFMKRPGSLQSILARAVGTGAGAGMGLIFVLAGGTGIILLLILSNHSYIRKLDTE
ncbi:MAG: MFS transporter [Lachnospiraceae bacterium]